MTHPPIRPYPIRGAMAWLLPAFPIAWLVGEILKDRFLPFNFLFYLPSLGCFLLGAIWVVWDPLRVRKSVRLLVAGVSLLALAKAVLLDFTHYAENPADPASIRLVHWNASRGRHGPERLVSALAKQNADVILLSEAPPDLDLIEIVPALFPNGGWFRTDGMAALSRFTVEPIERIEMPDGHAWVVRLGAPDREFDLLAVDLRANVFLARKPDLEALGAWVRARGDSIPLAMVGDFNTPADSIHFRGIRDFLDLAHNASGGGWPYSWPFPFPMLQIDHVWHSRDVRAMDHRYVFAFGSDHLMQVFDFVLPTEENVE